MCFPSHPGSPDGNEQREDEEEEGAACMAAPAPGSRSSRSLQGTSAAPLVPERSDTSILSRDQAFTMKRLLPRVFRARCGIPRLIYCSARTANLDFRLQSHIYY